MYIVWIFFLIDSRENNPFLIFLIISIRRDLKKKILLT